MGHRMSRDMLKLIRIVVTLLVKKFYEINSCYTQMAQTSSGCLEPDLISTFGVVKEDPEFAFVRFFKTIAYHFSYKNL